MNMTIVVPCYNEEDVLPSTADKLRVVLEALQVSDLVGPESGVCFVDDGSTDNTWNLIREMASKSGSFSGIKLSTNRGHQLAVLAGVLNVPGDAIVTIDADLQDDVAAIPKMIEMLLSGADIVYGVRKGRKSDSFFKRATAETYYRLLKLLGVNVVFNHADFRLMSRRAVESLRQYREVNVFLRGMVPELGFKTSTVYYDRLERQAGESKYPLRKMLALAADGVTSFSVVPLRMITFAGTMIFAMSLVLGIWALWVRIFTDSAVPGWASSVIPMYFLGGIQLLALGVIGEYMGKIYMETKRRPRFFVETTLGRAFRETTSQREQGNDYGKRKSSRR